MLLLKLLLHSSSIIQFYVLGVIKKRPFHKITRKCINISRADRTGHVKFVTVQKSSKKHSETITKVVLKLKNIKPRAHGF